MKTIYLRKISQVAFLLIYIILLLLTTYNSFNEKYPFNIFLRIDPLVALTQVVLFKTVIVLLLPAIFTVVLTIILGRFFCNWVCPLGTTFDILGVTKRTLFKKDLEKINKVKVNLRDIWKKSFKYHFLTLLLLSTLLSVQLIGFFDPLSLLTRTLTICFYPFLFLFNTKESFIFNLNILTLILFLIILGLSFINQRFWCTRICPLGALLGFLSKFALLRRVVNEKCTECKKCQSVCRMEIIEHNFESKKSECTFCLNCSTVCSFNAINYKFSIPTPFSKTESLSLSRRYFLTNVIGGILIVPFVKLNFNPKSNYDRLLRPPGALPEEEFLDSCIRCGVCMKACPTNIIQPAFLELGIESFYSPIMVSRIGFCDYECNLCGKVCPTGAIKNLPLKEKKKQVIGTAVYDKNRCLPWYKNVNCGVCEKYCPIPDKAIKMFSKEIIDYYDGKKKIVNYPYIDEQLCIGCGMCEYVCPVPGKAGVSVRKSNIIN